jgi:hypothetical protein
MSFTMTRGDSLILLTNSDESYLSQNLTEKTDEMADKHLNQTPSDEFNHFLIESIDEAITLLGEPVKNEFYLRLEVNFNMGKNDIPQRLEEFSDILQKVFGFGASRLEVKFLRNLDSKITTGTKCIDADWSVSMWIEKEKSFIGTINTKRKDFLLNIK